MGTATLNTMWCLTTFFKLFSTTESLRNNNMLSVTLYSKVSGNVTSKKSLARVGFLFMNPCCWTKCGCHRASAAIKRPPCKSNINANRMRDARKILRPKSTSNASRGPTIVCPHLLSQTLNLTLIVIPYLIKIQSVKQKEERGWSETCGLITQCSR